MNSCDSCKACCCRFIDLPINILGMTNDLRTWLNIHQNIEVITDTNKHILRIYSKCVHLTENNRCSIYNNRPTICKNFKVDGDLCLIAKKVMKNQ